MVFFFKFFSKKAYPTGFKHGKIGEKVKAFKSTLSDALQTKKGNVALI